MRMGGIEGGKEELIKGSRGGEGILSSISLLVSSRGKSATMTTLSRPQRKEEEKRKKNRTKGKRIEGQRGSPGLPSESGRKQTPPKNALSPLKEKTAIRKKGDHR